MHHLSLRPGTVVLGSDDLEAAVDTADLTLLSVTARRRSGEPTSILDPAVLSAPELSQHHPAWMPGAADAAAVRLEPYCFRDQSAGVNGELIVPGMPAITVRLIVTGSTLTGIVTLGPTDDPGIHQIAWPLQIVAATQDEPAWTMAVERRPRGSTAGPGRASGGGRWGRRARPEPGNFDSAMSHRRQLTISAPDRRVTLAPTGDFRRVFVRRRAIGPLCVLTTSHHARQAPGQQASAGWQLAVCLED